MPGSSANRVDVGINHAFVNILGNGVESDEEARQCAVWQWQYLSIKSKKSKTLLRSGERSFSNQMTMFMMLMKVKTVIFRCFSRQIELQGAPPYYLVLRPLDFCSIV